MNNEETKLRTRDINDILDLITGKWRGAVLAILCEAGPKRFSELKAELSPVTSTLLTKELRYLESNLMISAKRNTKAQNSALYAMTAHGKTIQPVIFVMQDWSLQHRTLMLKKLSK